MARRLGLSVFTTAAAVSIALAVLLPAPAEAVPASHVNWKETWKVNGVPVLSFNVTSVTVGKTKWTARVSFRNLLHRTVNIPRNSFGIAFYGSAKLTAKTPPEAYGLAKTFSKPRPARLGPGRSWTGVISGLGRPAITGKAWVRIVFGPFSNVPGVAKLSLWVTDHALVLTFGSKAAKPGGPLVI